MADETKAPDPVQDPRNPAVKPAWKSVETWIAGFLLFVDTLQGQHLIDLSATANTWMHVLAIVVVAARTLLKVAGVLGAAKVAAAEASAPAALPLLEAEHVEVRPPAGGPTVPR